ncbi:MAG: SH3 domain-containing protein, partial [Lachnospiraceae bacterium]|nr:SH3 domain-containing protein [Lachnospiraceae bacterium]
MKHWKIIRYLLVFVGAAALIAGALLVPPVERQKPGPGTETADETGSQGNETSVMDTSMAAETVTDPPETEDPETIRDALDEEFVPAAEDTEGHTGLRGFFVHKLVTDPEKVELYLNIRETPSINGKILYVMYPDDIVTYLGTQGDWYK